jgi:hypothetical protein
VGFEALFEMAKQEGDPILGLWEDAVAVEPFLTVSLGEVGKWVQY